MGIKLDYNIYMKADGTSDDIIVTLTCCDRFIKNHKNHNINYCKYACIKNEIAKRFFGSDCRQLRKRIRVRLHVFL